MKQLSRLYDRLLLLGAIASTGCTIQITNPLLNVDPNGLGPVIPKPTLKPEPQSDSCGTVGSNSASFVFPRPAPRPCPAIYPPPPGCRGEDRGVYGEFAGLRAPVAFQGLPDAAAVRARLSAIYLLNHAELPRRAARPLPGTTARPSAAPLTLMLTPPRPVWDCLESAYPELAQAFLVGPPEEEPLPEPSVAPEPEPWFPEPCLPGPSQTVTLSGMVFDGQGTAFPGKVEVRVNTPDFSFNAEAEVVDGRWEVSGAPAGARLQVTAVHGPSGESRRRFVVPQPAFVECGQEGFATVNFGGRPSDADPLGHRYALGVSAPAVTRALTAVSVLVYDVAGRPVPGAGVTLRSLDPAVPYDRTVAAGSDPGGGLVAGLPGGSAGPGLISNSAAGVLDSNGVVINGLSLVPKPVPVTAVTFEDVPSDVPLEVRAKAAGHFERVRVLEPLNDTQRYRFAFGGLASRTDPMAPQYALIPVPEKPVEARVTVVGKVFRQVDGGVVGAGLVRLIGEAGNESVRLETRLAEDGTYRFEGITPRTRAMITVEVPAYEPMVRLFSIGQREVATCNFGGPNTRTDPLAASFGLVERVK